jgi:RNA polymerase sigma-70 factor, ECF subfamily
MMFIVSNAAVRPPSDTLLFGMIKQRSHTRREEGRPGSRGGLRLQRDHEDVARLLERLSGNDPASRASLIERAYLDIKIIAKAFCSDVSPDHTLQTTALANEAVCRLLKVGEPHWEDPKHFFAYTAKVMRRILFEHAKARRQRPDRPGQRAPIDDAVSQLEERWGDVEALEQALTKLATMAPEDATLIELRDLLELPVSMVAQLADMPQRTVERHLPAVRAWLMMEIGHES